MAYTITSVNKTGSGTCDCADSGSPYTITADVANAFRNVAIGASFICRGTTYSVSSKASDSSIEGTYVSGTTHGTWTNQTWTYTNPALTLSTIQSLSIKKSSTAMKITLPTMDSDQLIAFDIDGVERSININAEVVDSTTNLSTVVIPTIEALCDGQQFTAGKFSMTTDMPSRTYYLFATDVSWEYNSEYVNKLQVNLTLIERGT